MHSVLDAVKRTVSTGDDVLHVRQERVELLDAVVLVVLSEVQPLLKVVVQCSAPLAQDLSDGVDGRGVADLDAQLSCFLHQLPHVLTQLLDVALLHDERPLAVDDLTEVDDHLGCNLYDS